MNIGRDYMFWFDNNPRTDLTQKVTRAAAHYQTKYGHAPNLCIVHPDMVKPDMLRVEGVMVRASRAVLLNHFWIGVNTS